MSLSVQSIGVRPYQSYGVSRQEDQPKPSFQMLKPQTTIQPESHLWRNILFLAAGCIVPLLAVLGLSGGGH